LKLVESLSESLRGVAHHLFGGEEVESDLDGSPCARLHGRNKLLDEVADDELVVDDESTRCDLVVAAVGSREIC
jgi:hypothetical protein